MLSSWVNSEEIAEVVYSYGEEMTERQIENRLGPLREAIKEIREAVAARPSTPSQVAPPNLNWLQRNPWAGAIFGATITAVVGAGFFGFFLPRIIDHATGDLDSRIDKRSEQKIKDHHVDENEVSLSRMESELKTLSENVNLLLGKSIKQASSLSTPEFKRQLPQIEKVLNAARRERIFIDPMVAKDLRDKLSSLTVQDNSEAWNATLTLAAYRSVFAQIPRDENNQPIESTAPLEHDRTHFSHSTPSGYTPSQLAASAHMVSKEDGAVMERIGDDLNKDRATINAFLFLLGGGVDLDGFHFKNVVIRNAHVVYHGGPIQMENVTFIDCDFSIDNTKDGRSFTAKSIESSPLTFAVAS
jgi:hypothetical protein